jgi:endo-1,4-beta-xylanase
MSETDTDMWQRFSNLVHTRPNKLVQVSAAALLAAGVIAVAACTNEGTTNNNGSLPVAADGSINLLDGQWNYMPGTTIENGDLDVGYRDFRIVEQDGSGGQPDPAVNEYGTHALTTGGFAVKYSLQNIKGPVTVSLDASPPIVSDEFRVNPAGIDLTLKQGAVSITVWDGKSYSNLADQQPEATKTFPVSTSNAAALEVDDRQGEITVDLNGKRLGEVADDSVFNTRQVWFGFNAGDETQAGNFTVSKLSMKPLDGSKISTIDTASEPAVQKDPNGLQELANKKRPGFMIGADVALWALASDPSYRKVVLGGNFGIVTPENAMKWQFTEPQPGVYDFHEADAIVNEALKNGLQVHGHNLVFSEALPDWVRNLPTSTPEQKAYVEQVMVDHITKLVTHFKGRVSEWDVVNEPVKDYNNDGSFDSAQPLRENVFYQAMGPDYIKIALEAAHKADPQAKLFINDYGNENDTGARWQATYNMLKSLEAELKPQGISLYYGFESHIYVPTTDDISNDIANNGQTVLTNNINALGALGIKSRVSEMDAPQQDPGYSQDSSSQAAQFSGTLKICLDNPNCIAFSMWSIGPTDLWQDDNHTLQLGNVDSPFNQNDQPVQPTYGDLQDVLR